MRVLLFLIHFLIFILKVFYHGPTPDNNAVNILHTICVFTSCHDTWSFSVVCSFRSFLWCVCINGVFNTYAGLSRLPSSRRSRATSTKLWLWSTSHAFGPCKQTCTHTHTDKCKHKYVITNGHCAWNSTDLFMLCILCILPLSRRRIQWVS